MWHTGHVRQLFTRPEAQPKNGWGGSGPVDKNIFEKL
jgi:hypothetical protein